MKRPIAALAPLALAVARLAAAAAPIAPTLPAETLLNREIPLREARALQQRLGRGETITLHAVVRARNDDAQPYETLVGTIPGTTPSAGDIVFSCHLDHEKPGANDNASGCSANLEIARTLTALISSKRLPPPARTIRFVWPSEMIGTIACLTKYPEIAGRIKAAVHLDMVGADPFVTKSVLHVTRSPWSIATVTDVSRRCSGGT